MPDDITVIIPDEGEPVIHHASDSPESGIEDLKRQVREAKMLAEEEQRRREVAEQVARDASARAVQSHSVATEREYESILTTIQSSQHESEQLRGELAKAMEEGDYDKASSIQMKITRNIARLERLEDGKVAMDERKNQPQQQPQQPRQAQPQPVDWNRAWSPAEAESVLKGYTTRTASWMRSNPRFFSDPSFRQQVSGAHQIAVGRGLQPDTDDYFRAVEGIVGGTPDQEETYRSDPVSAAQPVARAPAAPAAPPSRSVPSSRPQAGGRQVSLTSEEREMAKIMFHKTRDSDPDPEVLYARHKAALENEGRLLPSSGR